MSKGLILIVDDEPAMIRLLSVTLVSADYKVITAETGQLALAMAISHDPDAVLLDMGLPDMHGMEVLNKLQEWKKTPVIVVSAFQDEETTVEALDAGAVDYIFKPFRSAELLARLRVNLRKNKWNTVPDVQVFDDLEIHFSNRQVKRAGQLIKLTQTEFDLLQLLALNAGRVLTHQSILKEIWGVGHQADMQYLRVFIGTLRKKIEGDNGGVIHILTENRVGYRFQ
jgi:two-component system KDP operon response regulator KdpE